MHTLIDKYETLDCISSTETADVFNGEIKGIEGFRKPVVLKRYKQLQANDVVTLAKDTNITGMLNHANIVQVLDLGKWDEQWTVVTEQVRGTTLTAFIEWCHSEKFGVKDNLAAYIVYEIIRGIEYAHRQHPANLPSHILHRNLCPDNILIGVQGNIKIKNFSTQVQIVSNSPFHPPDTLPDARTDVWGIGAILHTMLVGIDKSDPMATQTSAPKNALQRITQLAVHPNPSTRFQSVAALKEALLDQYGTIPLDASIHMQEILSEMMGEPFAVLGDDATYISRTIASKDVQITQETIRQTVRMEVQATDELSLSGSAYRKNTTKPNIPSQTSTESESIHAVETSASSTTPYIFALFGLLLGIFGGWILFRQVYALQNTAELHWIIPAGTYIELGDTQIKETGTRTVVTVQEPFKASWVLSTTEKQDLKLTLQPGESRWINLECP